MSATSSSGGRVAYVAWAYPVVTQTFTVHEVRALGERLRERGVALDVFTGRLGGEDALDVTMRAARDGASVLPAPWSASGLAAAAAWFLRRPVRFLATLAACLGGRYRDDGLRCRLRAPVHFAAGAALASALRRRGGCRRVHAQFFDAGSTAAFAAARLLDLPLSIANHTAYNPFQLEAKLRRADLVISISEFDRAHLRSQCAASADGGRIVVSRVGILPDQWSGLSRRAEPGRILCVAAFREKKGHAVLVRAADLLRTEGVDVTLVFAGSGPLESAVRAQAASAGVRAEFLGAVGADRVREEMSRAALFCLPCVIARNGDIDGIPVALMEAMAAGVPVVSTRLSGIPELVEDGVTGRLAEPGDPASLAGAIRASLGSSGSDLVTAARSRVREMHDLQRTSSALAGLLLGDGQ